MPSSMVPVRSIELEAKMTGIIKFMNDSTGLCMLNTWGTQDILQLTADGINAASGLEDVNKDLRG